MSHPVGIGIAGLGRIARSHAAGYGRLKGLAEIRAVCDVDPVRAREFASEFGGRPVATLEDMAADSSIDAIDLILPHAEHHRAAMAVLRSGKHCMIEKPVAATFSEATEICNEWAVADRCFMVAENTRYVTAYQETEELLRKGAIGSINNVRTFLSSNMKRRLSQTQFWGRQYASGGGLILDSAPHSFYLLKWLLGDFDRVATSMSQVFPLDVEVEDVAEVTGSMVNGAHFVCGFSSVAELPHSERLELYGTSGAIIVDQLAEPVVKVFGGSQDYLGQAASEVPYGPDGWRPGGWHLESVCREVEDFVRSIIEGRRPLIDPADAAYSVAVIEAAYQAAGRGGPVQMSEIVGPESAREGTRYQ
jgi:UDP-N-acetyl-2-amino-2-deoxyglucuronate dehydrogenase